MTEAEWQRCEDPHAMLDWLHEQGTLSDRKARLVAVACCRRIWHLIRDERSKYGLEVCEENCDGKVSPEALASAVAAASAAYDDASRAVESEQATPGCLSEGVRVLAFHFAAEAVDSCFKSSFGLVAHGCSGALRGYATAEIDDDVQAQVFGENLETGERIAQASLVRDIAGNPFHSLPLLDPAWLAWNDGMVRRLAAAIYENRCMPEGTLDADRLAILADALEEAGCTDTDVLAHCRQAGPHVRGCWVLDLLLRG